MLHLLWDASALAKRFVWEIGTPTVNRLMQPQPTIAHSITFLGYAETSAVMRRKHNQGVMTTRELMQARLLLERTDLDNLGFPLLTIEDAEILGGIALTDRHNLNTSDAAILAAYLQHSRLMALGGSPCWLVASDQRLLRAAQAEGLSVMNPEDVPPERLEEILSV